MNALFKNNNEQRQCPTSPRYVTFVTPPLELLPMGQASLFAFAKT
jgi:hypothetical protein